MSTIFRRTLDLLLVLLLTGCFSIPLSDCGTEKPASPALLRVDYVEDLFGGAPVVTSIYFTQDARVYLEPIGETPSCSKLDAERWKIVLETTEQLKKAISEEPNWVKRGNLSVHESFLKLSIDPENAVEVIPGDLPKEVQLMILEIERLVREEFPRRSRRYLPTFFEN